MASDRWQQVEDLFHAALARSAEERRSFLADACHGDEGLLREVESLLAQQSGVEGFLSVPAAALAGSAPWGRTLAGARFGPYTIRALLGAGGMGEVYRAHDEALGRDVAIKVLSPGFTADAERRSRFEREARVLATLNHPHIGAIYGIEDVDGVRGLVLELVEGETLAERITRAGRAAPHHGLPEREALTIARQVADALEAAHEKGIVHRDLKPANVKVTPTGVVKVLDFGLAKIGSGEALRASQAPTITTSGTHDGAILGTVAYMSPEQARGKPIDKRTDIWAFGCVLYEMLTGRTAFRGDTASDLIAAILDREPDWQFLPARTPPDIRRLLQRTLQKDPSRRLHDAADVRIELDDAIAQSASGEAALSVAPAARGTTLVARVPLWRRLAVPTAAAILGGLTVVGAVWLTSHRVAPPVTRFEIALSGAAALSLTNGGGDFAVTPAGSVVYRGTGTTGAPVLVRVRDQLEPQPIAGLLDARDIFVSPDGQSIGFVSLANPRTISRAALGGGKAIPICSVGGYSRGATWGDDDRIIFAASGSPSTGLRRVSVSGGAPEVLTALSAQRGEVSHLWPEYLPGSQAVLFTIQSRADGRARSEVAILDLRSDASRASRVLVNGSQAHFLPSGHLVYADGASGALRAIRFDIKSLTVQGDPIPLPIDVAMQSTGTAAFDVGRDGTLAYVPASAVTAPLRTLVWVDRRGREEPIGADPRPYTYLRLSPDGKRVALDIRDQRNDIWVWDFASKNLTQMTFDPGFDRAPVWASDDDVVYSSQEHGGAGSLFRRRADGAGTAERLTHGPNVQFPTSVTPDGKHVLFWDTTRGVMSVTSDTRHVEQPLLMLPPPLQPRNAEVSPNGDWLAYESDESGAVQVFVRRPTDVNGWKRQVSSDGGTQPLWARDGKELFYLGPDGSLMGVAVASGPTWIPERPAKLVEGNGKYFPGPQTISLRTYDVSPDSQRFLMIKQMARPASVAIVVVQNWTEELKRLFAALRLHAVVARPQTVLCARTFGTPRELSPEFI